MKNRNSYKRMVGEKTREDIIQANLRKSQRGMNKRVEESEEIWLEMLEMILPLVVEAEMDRNRVEERVELAFDMSDKLLEGYEKRWRVGK